MPCAGQQHGHAVLVRGRDDFVVLYRAAGLYDCRHALGLQLARVVTPFQPVTG